MATDHITDIHCPVCGAPAEFDIVRQQYLCGYCGGKVEIGAAIREKQGFREMQAAKLRNDVRNYKMFSISCNRCGAKVVFGENEALSTCPFCGQALVRKEYLNAAGIPESVIPFRLTRDEAVQMLQQWCTQNPRRREAGKLKPLLPELKGFYLPYELVRGPVHMNVQRMDGGSTYRFEGFLTGEFVNRSAQLDNLLLDGMEPFDTADLVEFDFAYAAGQRVKTPDIGDQYLKKRADSEAEALYTPAARKAMQTKAVSVKADVSSAVRLPVLLPVYYICSGNVMAAVNGQTGKVSVRAEKDSHFIFLPWWLKAILATLVFSGFFLGAFILFGMNAMEGLLITAMLAVFFLVVTLCLYSDTTRNRLRVVSGRKIYTSGESNYRRVEGTLEPSEKMLERKIVKPVFFSRVGGEVRPVEMTFASPGRMLSMFLLAAVVLFLPVIIALLLNGFDFRGLNLGGSAVWFCIMVPVVPIYLLKFGIVELYERPLVYIIDENGKRKRYKEKRPPLNVKEIVKTILYLLVVPPASLAVWFGIISFCVMCYLTAFGWD